MLRLLCFEKCFNSFFNHHPPLHVVIDNCCIMVTSVLEYLESASYQPSGVVSIPYFHHAIIITCTCTVRPKGEVIVVE